MQGKGCWWDALQMRAFFDRLQELKLLQDQLPRDWHVRVSSWDAVQVGPTNKIRKLCPIFPHTATTKGQP